MSEPQLSLEEARRRAEEKRQSLTEATSALKERVETDTEEVTALVRRGRMSMVVADEAIRKHRWIAVGAAVAFGLALGHGRAKKKRRERLLDRSERAIVVQKAPKKPSLFGALFASVASTVAKEVALRIADSLQKKDED